MHMLILLSAVLSREKPILLWIWIRNIYALYMFSGHLLNAGMVVDSKRWDPAFGILRFTMILF